MHVAKPFAVLGVSAAMLVGGLSIGHGFPAGAQAHPAISRSAPSAGTGAASARQAEHPAPRLYAGAGESSDGNDPGPADVQQGDQSGPDGGAGIAETADPSAERSSDGVDTDTAQVQE